MARCAVPASLLVAALVGGSAGFPLVLAAVVALAGAALAWFGELVDGSADESTGALHVGLSSLALLLVLIAAVARGHAIGEEVPPLAISATVGAIVLLALQAALWCSAHFSRAAIVALLRSF